MLQLEILISECGPINGLTTCAVSPSEVTALTHEVGDDPVKLAVFEVQLSARRSDSTLSSA